MRKHERLHLLALTAMGSVAKFLQFACSDATHMDNFLEREGDVPLAKYHIDGLLFLCKKLAGATDKFANDTNYTRPNPRSTICKNPSVL